MQIIVLSNGTDIARDQAQLKDFLSETSVVSTDKQWELVAALRAGNVDYPQFGNRITFGLQHRQREGLFIETGPLMNVRQTVRFYRGRKVFDPQILNLAIMNAGEHLLRCARAKRVYQ